MSSETKHWTEEDFRRELRKLDDHVRKTQGIDLAGAELAIEFMESKRTYGLYYSKEKKFKFSRLFFDSDVPEECALDVVRHEYAHYYDDAVFGGCTGHTKRFKIACSIVGANPSTYYSRSYEAAQRRNEERKNARYESAVCVGQTLRHPVFGEGRVLKVEADRESAKLTVDFGVRGVRCLDEAWLKKKSAL